MGIKTREIQGGCVEKVDDQYWRLLLPAVSGGYTNAQIDDYGGLKRSAYSHSPGLELTLNARFSHRENELIGTAGFGFWNAPFGDPQIPLPALPQATWFFFASQPSDLPFPKEGSGRGWFAATIDASPMRAKTLVPLAPAIILLNQFELIRRSLWPAIRSRLGIEFAQFKLPLTEMHAYKINWDKESCKFWIDNIMVLETHSSPRGPLGFVSWIDNQFMVAKPTGRLRWGTLPVRREQWLELANLRIRHNV